MGRLVLLHTFASTQPQRSRVCESFRLFSAHCLSIHYRHASHSVCVNICKIYGLCALLKVRASFSRALCCRKSVDVEQGTRRGEFKVLMLTLCA